MVPRSAFKLLSYTNICCVIFLLFIHVSRSTRADTTPLVAGADGVLQVLVPNKTLFREFVDCSTDGTYPQGFCIDVFEKSISILSPHPNWTKWSYTCFEIGDASYDNLIDMLATPSNHFDAVVGDVTVSAARLANVSFTQSYLDSGIVIVAPADDGVSQPFVGVFLKPFSRGTWALTAASVLLMGTALWMLEHDEQESLREAPSRAEQAKRIFWFAMSIMVFFRKDSMRNHSTKFAMIAWIVYVLLLGSSYIASLSSILTVNQLSQKALSMEDLSRMNKPIGYQVGSVVRDYLTTRHGLTNLKELHNASEFTAALRNKEVVAIVEEIPYISLFLAQQSASDCTYSVSEKLTIEGLGFAFRNKSLSDAFSLAILNLSENGQMQKIQDGWKLSNFQCPSSIQATRLDLHGSQGLFVFLGAAMFLCIAIFVLKHIIIPRSFRAYARLTRRHHRIERFVTARYDFEAEDALSC